MAGALRSPAVQGIDYYESLLKNIDVVSCAGAAYNSLSFFISVYNIFIFSGSVSDIPTYTKPVCCIPAFTQSHRVSVLDR